MKVPKIHNTVGQLILIGVLLLDLPAAALAQSTEAENDKGSATATEIADEADGSQEDVTPAVPTVAEDSSASDQSAPTASAEETAPQTMEPGTSVEGADATLKDVSEISIEELLNMVAEAPSKKAEPVTGTSSVVTVITSHDIEDFGANNLLEVLERVAGLTYIGSYLEPNNVISVRGDLPVHYNVHVLILINGRPMREPLQSGVDFPIFHALPLSTIERIEVVRGPGSVLYGTNAYAGVINIVTKPANEDGARASAGYGSFNALTMSGAAYVSKEDLHVTAGVKMFRDRGWKLKAVDENGESLDARRRQRHFGGFVSMDYKGIEFQGLLATSAMGIIGVTPNRVQPGPPDPYPYFANRENNASRYFMDLGYTHEFNDDIKAVGHVTYNAFDARFPATTGPHVIRGNDILFEVTGYHTIFEDLSWLVGGTVWLQNGGSRVGDDPTRGIAYTSETWFTGYLEAQYQPFSLLKLIAGGQVNKAGNLDPAVVPRVGAIVNITDELGVKAQFGQAYRSAFMIEHYLRDAPVLKGEPDLGPETVTAIDAQVFYYTRQLQVGLAGFRNQSRDLISRKALTDDPEGFLFTYTNKGEFINMGGELEAKWVPMGNLFVTGSLSYQQNVLPKGPNDLEEDIENSTHIPNWMGKLGVSYDHKGLFTVGLFHTFFSEPSDVSVVNPDRVVANDPPTALNLLSAKVSFNFANLFDRKERLSLDVYGTNLLDESINYPEFARRNINSLPGRAGRAVFVELTGEI